MILQTHLLISGVGVLRADIGYILGVFKESSPGISFAVMEAERLSEPEIVGFYSEIIIIIIKLSHAGTVISV